MVENGDLTRDAGALLVRRADEKIGLTCAVAATFADERRANSVTPPIHVLLAQRIYALCCGWEVVANQ